MSQQHPKQGHDHGEQQISCQKTGVEERPQGDPATEHSPGEGHQSSQDNVPAARAQNDTSTVQSPGEQNTGNIDGTQTEANLQVWLPSSGAFGAILIPL